MTRAGVRRRAAADLPAARPEHVRPPVESAPRPPGAVRGMVTMGAMGSYSYYFFL